MLGEVIHGYRVDCALSSDKGGFGDVFFATHVESGAEAVVKVLKPEMSAQRDIVARFFNEARAAASVHHPGIVQIHNVGYHGDRAYLLMERLRGEDLETRLKAGPLPVERAVVFVRQTAGAIGAAHDRGIVHRDLKPANLFVVSDPDVIGGERIKVLDFGIAKLTVDAGAGKTQGVFGTPSYMSPEQCASSGAVDGRADLYSMGCIFYELLCGRPPFGHGGIELIASHLRDIPLPPRAIAPWVPPAIEQVILRLLEKQPAHRYASCAELIAALDEAARGPGVMDASMPHLPALGALSGGTPSSSTLGSAAGARSMPPPRRHGLGVWFGAAAVVVVGGAVVAMTALGGRHAPRGPIPTAPGDAGGAIAAPGDTAVVAVVVPDVRAVPDVREAPDPVAPDPVAPDPVAPGSAGSSARPIDNPARSPSQAAIAAELNDEGRTAMVAGRFDVASRKFQEALARVPDARYFLNLGMADFQAGRFGEADTALHGALANSPSAVVVQKANRMLALVKREAKAQGIELGDPDATVSDPAAPDPAVADAAKQNAEGKQLIYKGQTDDALAAFQRAYELDRKPAFLLDVCVALAQSGRCKEARRTCSNLIATWPTDPAVAEAKKVLARIGTCD